MRGYRVKRKSVRPYGVKAERELDEARAEVERLRRGIEAYRRLVAVHRVEAHGAWLGESQNGDIPGIVGGKV